NRHASIAVISASWTTSSASERFAGPSSRVSADTRRPNSRRNRYSTSARAAASAIADSDLVFDDGTHFDRTAEIEYRALARELHRLVQRRGMQHETAGDQILRFSVWPIGDDPVAPSHRFAAVVERLPARMAAALARPRPPRP